MQLALENLFSNAFKYSQPQEAPCMEFGRLPATNEFFVRDNGVGFPPQDSVRLFRPLSRLHSHEQFPNTGLGLISVARIIELHNKKIHAESTPDRGTAFLFSLPKSYDLARNNNLIAEAYSLEKNTR